jgi:DNA-directed RNA polymerase specialized sigma24 family protein
MSLAMCLLSGPTKLSLQLGPGTLAMNHTEPAAPILVHLDALYNLATWLARDATEAHGLVQATVRRALHMRLASHPGTNLNVRLLTIMWEIYCQQHTVHPDGAGPNPVGQAPAEKRGLWRTLSRVDLDAALRQLPEAQRATVILSDMEGYGPEEVAVILGWTRDRVQAALLHARRLLSDVLQARLTATQEWPATEGEDSR